MTDTPIYDRLCEEIGDPQTHIDAFDEIIREVDQLIRDTLGIVPQEDNGFVIVQEETLELTDEEIARFSVAPKPIDPEEF